MFTSAAGAWRVMRVLRHLGWERGAERGRIECELEEVKRPGHARRRAGECT